MWVPEAGPHAAGAGKWAGRSQAALKALPASETLGTTRTLPRPLKCQQSLWRGRKPLGSRGRGPSRPAGFAAWLGLGGAGGARERSPPGGERGGSGCDVALGPLPGLGPVFLSPPETRCRSETQDPPLPQPLPPAPGYQRMCFRTGGVGGLHTPSRDRVTEGRRSGCPGLPGPRGQGRDQTQSPARHRPGH